MRASLQEKASKGTRSARRRARQIWKRLSGRERRYQTWLNHNISKLIVLSALQHHAIIAIEDLTGIRERTKGQPRNKTERRRSQSWAFFQLRLFVSYKAVKYGVEVIADENASKMISIVGAVFVNPLGGSVLSCYLADHIRATESPRLLAVG